jgi:NADP-dependent aldehyde dehydrogenase
MSLHGKNFIGYALSGNSRKTFAGHTATPTPTRFHPATAREMEKALQLACEAFRTYRNLPGSARAAFLRAVADQVEALGHVLVATAMAESGLPEARLLGERARTCGQLRLFADLLEEGSWVGAVIDRGNPARQPLPKPDIRRMLLPVGPVAVFTASNFPLAFSTAGGDTASALAAGCPVVVKAHEAHPATNELVAGAICAAARESGMPDGVFSSLHGGHALGKSLVRHPLIRAVAFTGSFRGGKALFDLAVRRPVPIPVFAEMGSVNPVVVLPDLPSEEMHHYAARLAASVLLGAGQFCTNPGLVFLPESQAPAFGKVLRDSFVEAPAQCMLNHRIRHRFAELLAELGHLPQVDIVSFPAEDGGGAPFVRPALGITRSESFLRSPMLREEVFGPFTLLVTYRDAAELPGLIRSLPGQLTATVVGAAESLASCSALLREIGDRVGRILFNGVPTGVEVGYAMQHGGPFPATTDARSTSVGTDAILRFVRPVAFQDFPDQALPPALQDDNPLRIRRMVDGQPE